MTYLHHLPMLVRSPKKDLLQELRFKQNACRKRNHQQVVEEDKRINTPIGRNSNAPPRDTIGHESKHNEDEEEEDYILNMTAEQAEEREKRKNRKKKGSFGWEMFNEQAHHNSYKRRMKDLNGNKDYKQTPPPPSLQTEVSEVGPLPDEALYGRAAKPSQEGLDRMVAELGKAEERRAKFSRRRETNPSADISYINERNKIFNKKIARAFDQYTVEIRQNLERGTAL